MDDRTDSDECARYLKALADPDRLRIIRCLQSGPKSVTQLAELLGRELVNVSHHLRVLRYADLVRDLKQGRYVIYSFRQRTMRSKKTRGPNVECIDLGCCRLEWA